MSESSTETSTAEAAVVADPLADTSVQFQEAPERDDQEQGIDWKSKSREWEKRAKANASAAKKLEELEDAKKSEVERVTGRLTKAEAERDDAVAKLLRYEVAAATGIPPTAAHRLQGSSREELEADARELAKLLADKKEAERKENLVDPSAGRGSSAGSSTAEQFAAMFSK
ncbi:hypothetical protein [Nocardiopsis eucommiae]|uniref:hypothetical protein n=1 Tax=Nocardiopsis eucommiae TaxID=2831970 RepID=UPI003D70E6C5